MARDAVMSKNSEIAAIFENISDMLSVLDENPFKIRAYKKAATNVLELSESVEDTAERGELTDIPGIGKDLADKIEEYLESGKIKEYEKLKKKVPMEVIELLRIQGLGPKTLSLLFKDFGVRNLEDLERVLNGEKIRLDTMEKGDKIVLQNWIYVFTGNDFKLKGKAGADVPNISKPKGSSGRLRPME